MQKTPQANRLHIGIFGKVNSGKSTLLNHVTGQEVAIVSKQAGTTTDPIYKAMELVGIGPVVFIDSAGFQDISLLGDKRIEKTKEVAKQSDIAIVVFADEDIEEGMNWIAYFKQLHTPCLLVVNDKKDNHPLQIQAKLLARGMNSVLGNIQDMESSKVIIDALLRLLPEDYNHDSITHDLVREKDVVVLVMPQDIQAPKGRLILPQVQVIRELLDKHCIVMSCDLSTYQATLQSLKQEPTLIICDSQVFKEVYENKPKGSKLTSFSILFAGYKGDLQTFIDGAQAIDTLHANAKVLIAEACTHAPVGEDIGRVKIPNMLKKRFGDTLQADIVSGKDFPEDVSNYDLIIHCGACMFNRKYVLARIKEAKEQGVPITNYGVVIAYLNHILDKISV